MTKDEAEAILLRHALQEAQHIIKFLHGCLTNPMYKYAYPEQTLENLKEFEKLAPIEGSSCHHSMTVDDCPSCISGSKMYKERKEALKVLGMSDSWESHENCS